MKKESQTTRLYNLLSDNLPHRTDEIQIEVYGRDHLGTARISGRISEIKQGYGVRILGWHDEDIPSLYWYQMLRNEPEQTAFGFSDVNFESHKRIKDLAIEQLNK